MGLIKLFAIASATAVGVMGAGTLAILGYLFTGGVASVQVDSTEQNLYIPVPLRLADLALGVAAIAAPEEELAQVREEAGRYMPMVRDLASEISSLPEGEIVRVDHGDGLVVVEQRGGHFRVDVESEDGDVTVTLPRRAAGRLLRKSAALLGD